jgi:hypothetical protein
MLHVSLVTDDAQLTDYPHSFQFIIPSKPIVYPTKPQLLSALINKLQIYAYGLF